MKLKHRILAFGLLAVSYSVSVFAADVKSVAMRGPATLKELMTLIVEPTSNGVFYVASQPPKNDAEWKTLQGQALTLLEAANSLTTTNRSKDKKQWMADAKLLQEASKTAFAAAMAKNITALADLNDPLYTACSTCHEHYLPKR